MMLIKNPELQRYFWLEFSVPRLIAMPILQIAIFFIAYHEGGMKAVFPIASALFILFAFVWGVVKAGSSVLDELNDNTWDFQRLSAMSPLELLIGKLFGSTSYAWYGGFIAMVFFVLSGVSLKSPAEIIQKAILLILATLLSQVFALLSSLVSMLDFYSLRRKSEARVHYLIGLIVGGYFLGLIMPTGMRDGMGLIVWYNIPFNYLSFLLYSYVIWLFWLFLAVYMNFKIQLRMRTYPLAWVSFLIFGAVYFSGFFIQSYFKSPTIILLSLFSFSLLSAYCLAGFESLTIVHYRKWLQWWRRQEWDWVMTLFPRWIVSLLLSVIVFVLACFTELKGTALLIMMSITGFVVRDILLFHYVAFFTSPRKAKITICFYLIMLYVVLPLFFNIFHMALLVDILIPFARIDFAYNDMTLAIFRAIGVWLQVGVVAYLVYGKTRTKIETIMKSI